MSIVGGPATDLFVLSGDVKLLATLAVGVVRDFAS